MCFKYLNFWGGGELGLRAYSLEKQTLYSRATPPVHFVLVILEMKVSQTLCPGWPQTSILPISASQVARITGTSHQCPAVTEFLFRKMHLFYFSFISVKAKPQTPFPHGASLTKNSPVSKKYCPRRYLCPVSPAWWECVIKNPLVS
jgi:hypothetical protein